MKPWMLAWVGCVLGSACHFDEAFQRYCDQNPNCLPDGSAEVSVTESHRMAIPPPRLCGRGLQCEPGWTCHPMSEICMQTCTVSADCPAWNHVCSPLIVKGGGTQWVCQCSGASCQNANIDFTCSLVDQICERQCVGPKDCAGFRPPRVCDTFAGFCVPSQATCRADSDCLNRDPARPRCDTITFQCVP